jgi:membrane protein required for colicin V production
MVDLTIVIVMLLAVLSGLSEGFFRSFCSLGGLLLGLLMAAWNYGHVAALILPYVRIRPVANAIGFLLIALIVMGLAGVVGQILSRTFRSIGLGCLDRLAGGIFGFFKGALLVTLVILVTVAFFPSAQWLTKAHLPRLFFGACHLSTHMSPVDLAERIRQGLRTLEEESPLWLHPGGTA